jgi:phosphatidylinositol 4-kinase type 2
MFVKQMAVMKGQAWNVVETLKTPDHGPLELTRRAKVCVWDDLVDVPVAVPMRVTSSELRRQASDIPATIDEVDIGATPSSSAPARTPAADALGLGHAPADIPSAGRFELSPSGEDAQSPDETSMNGSGILGHPSLRRADSGPQRPAEMAPRASYQGPSRTLNLYSSGRPPGHMRRFSFATATGRKASNTIAQHLYAGMLDDDDVEGDLGYAAAEGMEGNRRKVIVERLEMVKAKNPVFTWC